MKKYKVVRLHPDINNAFISNDDLKYARELQEQFGLYTFSLEEIYLRWNYYSENYHCASWLTPTPEAVEEVFCVQLEEK